MERFPDRRDAGCRLAGRLSDYRDRDCVVLALPRGGVPVAAEIARQLSAPLDLLMVRKIGAPGHPEFAIGAVVDGAQPQHVMNDHIPKAFRPPDDYVESEIRRLTAEIERRRQLYLGDRAPVPVAGRCAILVDDGIATGATALAALRALARLKPAEIVLAVPVAAPDALERLRPEADRIICLLEPWPFRAVGLHYENFDQVQDAEVMAALRESQGRGLG